MANKSFKTPGTMHLEMEAERKAADIKTAIRSFQTALDQDVVEWIIVGICWLIIFLDSLVRSGMIELIY